MNVRICPEDISYPAAPDYVGCWQEQTCNNIVRPGQMQIYELMGNPTGERQRSEVAEQVIVSRTDFTFQVSRQNHPCFS